MASSGSRPHAGHVTPDEEHLRIVLLGYIDAGKSSSGNTILGREEFDTVGRTAQCVMRQREVAGRHVTVVEAPGWNIVTTEYTPTMTKEEIELSVSLCPPGPYAILLVTSLKILFTEMHRQSVQEHLELLGERVWSHTIVLFTCGDWLGDTPIEQHIESEGESLQWLVEKCGNRYHVLNNERRDDHMQVTQLMEKIEEMVAANRGQCYEVERWRIEELEEKSRRAEVRGKERMMKVKRMRESLRSQMGDSLHQSELRIVLLGIRNEGKSSSGNTILGREECDTVRTVQCVKRQGEVAGRHVTVVEAPGWKNILVYTDDTPTMTKEEIELSVSLCPPGPQALLLVIRVDRSFTDKLRRSVQQHLELLGERVWRDTMVLFTHGDWLGDRSIEQHIESEGESLQWLVEQCGNRYHVLNNERRDDHMQVTQLMEKIEEMVAANRGQCYEVERWRIEELEKKRRSDEERAKERMMNVKRERESLRSQMGDFLHLSELRIVLLGIKYGGKSSSANIILGREEFGTVGKTAQCVKRQGVVAGRHVTVVEAPGWNTVSREYTPNMTKEEIELSVSLCPPGPHALLLVIGVDRSFTGKHRRSVQEHLEILSERVWNHTILLFTRGDLLGDTPIEQHIDSEGESLQWLIAKCGNRYHVLNNEKSDDHMQVTQLMEKIEEMVAANRGQCFEMERRRIEESEDKRRREEEGKERESLRSQMGESLHLSELRIVLLGYRDPGKSSSGNTILGREEFDTARRTAKCVKRQGEVAGRHVTVVEAPGWWRNSTVDQTPNMTKEEIELSASLCLPGPHALLLVLGMVRSFTEEVRRSMQEHSELLGERVWSQTIVLFTWGDWLGHTPIEQYIESEGEGLQWLVEKCGNRYHVLNNERRDDHMQVTQLMEKIEEMVAVNKGQCYENRQEQQQPLRKARSYDLVPPSMSGAPSQDDDRWSLSSTASGSYRSVFSSISSRSTVSSQSSGYESSRSGSSSSQSSGSRTTKITNPLKVRKGLDDILEVYDKPTPKDKDTREKRTSVGFPEEQD
ncbi:GTPase IMAP family member 8-like [Engraulis encrasicolus]|uniref:GTPase IMAP family member 8-like n=1 Tax=Engraulis encrasicolus TaxID=184585 RepID=UPI002FD75536